jgi:predicted amidohydrolase
VITVALAQIDTRLGEVQANLDKHLARIEAARLAGADLVVFPELSLTGYQLQDLTPTVARRAAGDDPIFKPLLAASRKLDIL